MEPRSQYGVEKRKQVYSSPPKKVKKKVTANRILGIYVPRRIKIERCCTLSSHPAMLIEEISFSKNGNLSRESKR